MKRLFLLLAVVITSVFFLNSLVSAKEKKMVNEKGELRIVKEKERLREFTRGEERACKKPGKEIPLLSDTATIKRVDFLHFVQIQRYNKVIVFDGSKCVEGGGKFSEKEKRGEIRGSKKLAIHTILLILAVFFMAISNISLRAGKDIFAAAFAADESIKAYKIYAAIFYILAVAAMVI